jgi:uncharacterized protein (DUF1697 family)
MPVVICMLRGVNVGVNNRVKMDDLKKLCTSLKICDPQTYVQSGNIVFTTDERDLEKLRKNLETAIHKKFGFQSAAIFRSAKDLREIVANNPFAKRKDIQPGKLLVTFFSADPGEAARKQARAIKCDPEELFIEGREAYIYFPDGAGRSKLNWSLITKTLKVEGTARNWNSVTKMLEMAEKLEKSQSPAHGRTRETNTGISPRLLHSFSRESHSRVRRRQFRTGPH